MTSQEEKLLKEKVKEQDRLISELNSQLEIEKFKSLKVSTSLSKLIYHFEDERFGHKNWIRFLLTSIYHDFRFKKDDPDFQKAADYIKSSIDLYP